MDRRQYNRNLRKRRVLATILCGVIFLLSGCSLEEKKIVLYSGFAKDEVFRIDKISCSIPEIMIYLTATQNRYEAVYGEQIWETKQGEITMEESMKEMVLAQVSQIKTMNLLAEKENLELTKEEKERVDRAAEEFFGGLKEREIQLLEVDLPIIQKVYEEYAVANKLYDHFIKDINPEVSDDEARTITVEHILIKTYTLDEKGEPIQYGEEERKIAYNRIKEVQEKIKEGQAFDKLAEEYNEDQQTVFSFRKGEMNLEYEMAAFNLGQGEISDIIETEYGYHIIKCITTFNQEETDANKIKIVEKKREEAFDREYTDFALGVTKVLNEPLWNSICLWTEEVNCQDFFNIYEKYLGNNLSE